MLELHYARRGKRHSVDMLCELIRRDFDVPIRHRIVDLSAFGAWLHTTFPMPIGARVVLVFTPPGEEELMVFAEVTRVREPRRGVTRPGMGVAFLDLTADERRRLQQALGHLGDETVRVMQFARLLH